MATTEYEKWYRDLQVKRTIEALKKNNFDAVYAPDTADALRQIFSMVPEGATVGVGGSVTLAQIGFFDEVKKHKVTLLNPGTPGLLPEDGLKMRKEILTADVFLASSNAVTEEGAVQRRRHGKPGVRNDFRPEKGDPRVRGEQDRQGRRRGRGTDAGLDVTHERPQALL